MSFRFALLAAPLLLACGGAVSPEPTAEATPPERSAPTARALPSGTSTVSSAGNHVCALDPAGAVFCWGVNEWGQVAPGAGPLVEAARRIDAPYTYRRIAAGLQTSCGIRIDGTLHCWGLDRGQLLGASTGSAEHPTARPPVRVGVESDWEEIAVGMGALCGIRGGGRLFCWGQLDWGAGGVAPIETAPGHAFREVSLHYYGAVALDSLGQVFYADFAGDAHPFAYAPELSRAQHVAMGIFELLTVSQDGAVTMLKAGAPPERAAGAFASVAGAYNRCAVSLAGELLCQETRHATAAHLSLARRVVGSDWTQVAVGMGQVCAAKKDGTVWCLDVKDDAFGDGPPRRML